MQSFYAEAVKMSTGGLTTSSLLIPTLKMPIINNYVNEIEEIAAKISLCNILSSEIKVPSRISDSQSISGTFCKYQKSKSSEVFSSQIPLIIANNLSFLKLKFNRNPPLVFLHGFDSSCLEFRRLSPLLSEDRDIYVPDILGWGFIDHNGVKSFSPDAKIEYIRCFLEQIVSEPCILVGASLGGALAITLATEYPDLVKKVILIDAQGFIDGKGPSNIPDSIASLGVKVLKSKALRMYANVLAYSDSKTFATEDAMRIGRLHCFTESWERASIAFLKSGGFVVSHKVSEVKQDTLVLWGRNDKILEPATAERFQSTMNSCTVKWVEDCGHVPHLEKPVETAELITEFLNK